MEKSILSTDTLRKDSWVKVTGEAKYTGDLLTSNILHARILTSPYAHGKIISINIEKAKDAIGVQSVITGDFSPALTGPMVCDRHPIAKDKVRYFGEPVALVVANSEEEAMNAINLIEVEYEKLPVVNSISDAIKENATLVHEDLGRYFYPATHIYPDHNSNIIDHVKIRKGNMDTGWAESDIVLESSFSIPQSDHIAMETRNATAQILRDGTVIIESSTQAPFAVKEELSKSYQISEGNIIVRTPYVGGAFGGKATVQIEFLAYLASLSVGGRKIRIANSREEDMMSSPSKLGSEAMLKIGATKEGLIKALGCTYIVDCGAYADTGPRMAKSIASGSSGPYNIDNIHCDSISVYTNHSYVTSYRGFGYVSSNFSIERMIDKLADALDMDPFDIRIKNSIKENDLTPNQVKSTLDNTGDLNKCLLRLKELMNWEKGSLINQDGKIIARGISSFWKGPNSPTNATSGSILTLNSDGSINLNFGATEIGPGMKTTVAMILAEKMKMELDRIHVVMEVDTRSTPKHWKTVASMSTYMAGNATIKAADDLIYKLKKLASIVFRCSPEDLEVANEMVYSRSQPDIFIEFKKIVHGYKYEDGKSIWGQIIASGSFIFNHLTPLDAQTGLGQPAETWTVGAQGVELEYNPKDYTYRLLKAYTVIDAGKVIHPKLSEGVIMGGMAMGLGLATREDFIYDKEGILENTSLRTYKVIRYGENPEFIVDFIETPQNSAPFGARGIGEHGILGIPSAFANAMSKAIGKDLNTIPITPEMIWRTKEVDDDSL